MPSRNEGPQVDAPLALPVASYSITREGMTVWQCGQPILRITREGLVGHVLRCLIAYHEGR